MSVCGICAKSIGSSKLKLSCNDCKREFHASCLGMSKADVDCIKTDDLVWRCKNCAATRRKSMRFESQGCEGNLTLEDVMSAINELKGEQKKYEADVNKSFEHLHEKLVESHNALLEESRKNEKYFTLIEEILSENKALKEKVNKLENRLEDLEQYSRTNALEIHGVPQEANENVIEIVKEVGRALDITIADNMIDACHRLGKRQNNSSPGIIVKFVRRFDKEEFLRKRRVKRNLNLNHIHRTGESPIYVNESLSPERRKLLALARAAKREKGYTFLWVRNGKIFLRKKEGTPVIIVTRQEDLSKL